MKILALDVGSSGVKHAWVEASETAVRLVSAVRLLKHPELDRFGAWLASRLPERPRFLAVSCAGLVDEVSGVNRVCTIAGWWNRPLRAELEEAFRPARVVILNDVEAHLFAHVRGNPGPVMVMAMGTSVGLAVSDEQGRIVRSRGGLPLEFGTVRLKTSAACDELWSALGTVGLKDLQEAKGNREGAVRFGYRIGATLAQYATVFWPRTIVVSGGIVESQWATMQETAAAELAHGLPSWLRDDPPRLVASPHGGAAALIGVAEYARGILASAGPE